MVSAEEETDRALEPEVKTQLSASSEESGHVLVHHHPGAAQHLRPRHRALQSARVAGALPGDSEHVLCRPIHAGNASKNVCTGLSGKIEIHDGE